MRIITITSDHHLWYLKGFMHQWKKYCGTLKNVTIAGFTEPNFLPIEGFDFYSIGKFSRYPIQKWSNAIIDLLKELNTVETHALIMMEDYWLTREIDCEAVNIACKYMEEHPEIIRFCMTEDRMNGGMPKDICAIKRIDMIRCNKYVQYNMSFQASIWNISHLLKIMVNNETPWEAELGGNDRINKSKYEIWGTRQIPIKYQIMCVSGQFSEGFEREYPYRRMSDSDLEELRQLGYTQE